MSYIRIRNESKPVDRRYFEKLGAGDKRNDEKTIGQFGSGSCFAPLAAMRGGREYVVCGFDNDGLYNLRYDYETVNGIDEVYFHYTIPLSDDFDFSETDTVRKSSSFTLQAGQFGWNDPWQIFREAASNALDEHYEYGAKFTIEVVDEIDAPEKGYVSVYITADPEMQKIANSFDTYYTINRKPLCEDKFRAKFFKKIDGAKLRVYMKGVLVHEGDEDSLWDYELPRLQLSEDRSLKSTWELRNFVTQSIFCLDDEDMIREILDADRNGQNVFELKLSAYDVDYYDVSSQYADTFHKKYGNNVVAVPPNVNQEVLRIIRTNGYKGIIVHSDLLRKMLEKAGVTKLLDVVGTDPEYEKIEPSPHLKKILAEAMDIVSFYEPALDKIPVQVFAPNANQTELGIAFMGKDPHILISDTCLELGLPQTVSTLIHEVDHCITQHPDLSREFRDKADNRLAELMINNFKRAFCADVMDDYAIVPHGLLSMTDGLNYAIIAGKNIVIIQFEGATFKLDGAISDEMFTVEGEMEVHKGKLAFHIPNGLSVPTILILEEIK